MYKVYNRELTAWAALAKAAVDAGTMPRYHAVLCDPPYGISFMGKAWDDHGGPAAFQEAVKLWGDALLPLLYPGAVVMMFGGTRMWHRLAAGMEDAGFAVWDSLMWLHGQGFPKGQDLSKLIDKQDGRIGESTTQLKTTLKEMYKAKGFTQQSLDTACGFSAWSYASERNPWNHVLPDSEKWEVIKSLLAADDTLDAVFAAAEREVVGKARWTNSAKHFVPGEDHTERVTLDTTAPGSATSAPWASHKTLALKPAWEPVLCFVAPRQGKKYVECALEYGSGTLNIDGGRIGLQGEKPPTGSGDRHTSPAGIADTSTRSSLCNGGNETSPLGRYPANLIIDEVSAQQLDEQSGERAAGSSNGNATLGTPGITVPLRRGHLVSRNDLGGASRFFKVIRSCAEGVCQESQHGDISESPTVAGIASGENKEVERYTHRLKADGCGNENAGQFQQDTKFTTKTKTQRTMKCQTSSASLHLHTTNCTHDKTKTTQPLTELNTEDVNAVTSTNYLASSTPEQPGHTADTAKVAHRSHLSNGEQQTENTTTDTCANTDVEETSRFFYTAKSSTAERNAGLSDKNVHPTLKPIDLTRYLATLLLPPSSVKRRRLLVPFSGSGSEMIGGILAGWDEVVGVEQSAEYCAIAEQRLRFWSDNATNGATTSEILKAAKKNNVTPIPVATQTEVNQCNS